mmetsp:Transcript_4377/g.16196  ORF Transcript_4377/g.16196 Transcript_4377/m.16196 type:complete len:148 (+) Transcript_4377:1122-1565(+)
MSFPQVTVTTTRYPTSYLSFNSVDDPAHAISPSCNTVTRVPKRSASSRWCVVINTAFPFAFFRSSFCICRRARGSTPAVGSSRTTLGGSPAKARATDSRLRIPPDSDFAVYRFLALSSTSFSRVFLFSSNVFFPRTPRNRNTKSTWS